MALSQQVQKTIKGCLEVRALCDTRMGCSDTIIPKDSIGYVIAIQGIRSPEGPTGYYGIYWVKQRVHGSHHKSDVIATGNRG